MSDFERNKDQVQAGVQAGASLVGRIAVIITNAVGSIAKEIGDFVTEGIEMREAARVSRREERQRTANDPRADQDGIDARAEDDNDPRG
ncbi:hypothetical protein JTP68_10495 [Dietzia cinnamea]|uniref:hypothetical protein n=1 Tax=Dietzia cinnamea TaxID=321318 RepID=UPI000D608FCD|nr:hypothetical protein [Dietzia cinnamea]PWD96059.1 hypothetical protein DEQ16_07330 [Dietzia maris]